MTPSTVVDLFKMRAAEVSAGTIELPDLSVAAPLILALVEKSPGPVVALPEQGAPAWDQLESQLTLGGARVVRRGLRNRGQFDLGVTSACWGIAETGTVVMDARDEDVRIAATLSEIHVIVLDRGRIRPDLVTLLPELRPRLTSPNYVAFVTGPSRTADIESVLALGAHGPRRVEILITGNSTTEAAEPGTTQTGAP